MKGTTTAMKRLFGHTARTDTGAGTAPGRAGRTIYLVATSGHPNFGDELILRSWLRFLAAHEPHAEVWVDCPAPGPTAPLMRDEHPGLRTTDTLYRLCWEAPSDDPRVVAEFVGRALEEPGEAPRWIPGIDVLRRSDVVHVLGGGYINDVWPRHHGLVAGAAWMSRRGARVAATGLGLQPAGDAAHEVWQASAAAFDVLTVRDETSLKVVTADAPRATLAPDDVLLSAPSDVLDASSADAPDVMVCVQTDMLDGDFADVVSFVRTTLQGWGVGKGDAVGFVECIPRVDRAIYDALRGELPEARFYSLWDLLAQGLPARPGQRWISSRYHPHLLAAQAGASGVALSLSDDYYSVKHGAVTALGSGWTLATTESADVTPGGPGRLPSLRLDHGARLRTTARAIYGAGPG